MDEETLQPRTYYWAIRLNSRIDELFSSYKSDIDSKIQALIDEDLLDISEENSQITDEYSALFNDFITVKPEKRITSHTIFAERIKDELLPDYRRIVDDKRVHYFFNRKFDKFWEKLKAEYEKTTKKEPNSFSLTHGDKILKMNKDDVLEFVAQVRGRWLACQYAHNVVRNGGVYKPPSGIGAQAPFNESTDSTNVKEERVKQDHALRTIALYYMAQVLELTFENHEERVNFLYFLSGYQLTKPFKETGEYYQVKKVFKADSTLNEKFTKGNLEIVRKTFKNLGSQSIVKLIDEDLDLMDT